MPEMIDIDEAMAGIVRKNSQLVDGLAFTGTEFPGWTLVRVKRKNHENDGVRLSTYIWAAESNPDNIRVKMEILEGTDAETVSQQVKTMVENLTSSHLLGSGKDSFPNLGDFSLLRKDRAAHPELLDFIVVAEANIGLRYSSIGNTRTPVVRFAATALKSFFADSSPAPFDNAFELELTASQTRIRVGETVELSYRRLNAPDSVNFFCLVAFPPACRLFRQDGKSLLEAKAPGPLTLLAYNFDPEFGRSMARMSFNILP